MNTKKVTNYKIGHFLSLVTVFTVSIRQKI